jgi:NAD(P)H-nitrite reductase large subunit
VIVGGGASGLAAADNLRSLDFNGKITILTSEPYPPIDRTKLSKALITNASSILLRTNEVLKDLEIGLKHTKVTKVDVKSKSVTTEEGENVEYDKLVLATGGSPRMLPLPGFKELKGIYTLRTVPETKEIVDAVSGGKKKVVIVGTGFIGMEIAIALRKENDINIIGMEKVPLYFSRRWMLINGSERVLGEKIGQVLMNMHSVKGIKFHMGAFVEAALPSSSDSSHVGAVKLKDGTIIPADVVIMAVGIGPSTEFLKTSGFNLEKDGSLKVDKYMRVEGVDDVYATGLSILLSLLTLGDIATFPYSQQGGKDIRIEHWDVAINHGRTVANHIVKGDSYEGSSDNWNKCSL